MVGIGTRPAVILAVACIVAGCDREAEPAQQETVAADSAPAEPVATELAVWDVRFDEGDAGAGGFQMTEQPGGGWAIRTGPSSAAITWRDGDMVQSGAFTVSATMEELGAPAEHREGYGLFVGGRNLQQPDQQYTYFLVRGDGGYLVKRRDGASTPTYKDWTPSPAIQKVTSEGQATRNTLEIRVQPDVTRFLVNGTEVTALPTDQVQPYGIAGLRVNHGLDMKVTGFAAQAGSAASAEARPPGS